MRARALRVGGRIMPASVCLCAYMRRRMRAGAFCVPPCAIGSGSADGLRAGRSALLRVRWFRPWSVGEAGSVGGLLVCWCLVGLVSCVGLLTGCVVLAGFLACLAPGCWLSGFLVSGVRKIGFWGDYRGAYYNLGIDFYPGA